jgi:hypothetical protein
MAISKHDRLHFKAISHVSLAPCLPDFEPLQFFIRRRSFTQASDWLDNIPRVFSKYFKRRVHHCATPSFVIGSSIPNHAPIVQDTTNTSRAPFDRMNC